MRRTVAAFIGVSALFHPPRVEAAPSLFYAHAGVVQDDDSTIWCRTLVSSENRARVEASLVRVPSDIAEPLTERASLQSGSLRARVSCTQLADGSGAREELTSDAAPALVTLQCPDHLPFAQPATCQIDAQSGSYVYLPAETSTDHVPRAQAGASIKGITRAEPCSQVTGHEAKYAPPPGYPTVELLPTNQDLMRGAAVAGTDEGAPFLAGGKLHFVFGDTTDLVTNSQFEMGLQPVSTQRSNVLAATSDFDPSDGLRFDTFETRPGSSRAIEVVPSRHDQTEVTAIPLAGVGLTTPQREQYRILWYVSIQQWENALLQTPTTASYSGFAYSRNGSPDWTRLPAPSPQSAADFGPGAIWFDRLHRYLYLFGIRPASGPVRLARVPASFDALVDPAAREYWNGTSWIRGDAGAAHDILPVTPQFTARSEISVAFNAAAGVWTMMLLNASTNLALRNPGQLELWQAPAVTGPWTKVDADAQLPRGSGDAASYGPMMSEHLMRDGGREVYFLSSQWWPVYNVHLWSFRLQ